MEIDKAMGLLEEQKGSKEELNEALRMGVQALQKQVPAKAQKKGAIWVECPSCGAVLQGRRYCHYCGQALKLPGGML